MLLRGGDKLIINKTVQEEIIDLLFVKLRPKTVQIDYLCVLIAQQSLSCVAELTFICMKRRRGIKKREVSIEIRIGRDFS